MQRRYSLLLTWSGILLRCGMFCMSQKSWHIQIACSCNSADCNWQSESENIDFVQQQTPHWLPHTTSLQSKRSKRLGLFWRHIQVSGAFLFHPDLERQCPWDRWNNSSYGWPQWIKGRSKGSDRLQKLFWVEALLNHCWWQKCLFSSVIFAHFSLAEADPAPADGRLPCGVVAALFWTKTTASFSMYSRICDIILCPFWSWKMKGWSCHEFHISNCSLSFLMACCGHLFGMVIMGYDCSMFSNGLYQAFPTSSFPHMIPTSLKINIASPCRPFLLCESGINCIKLIPWPPWQSWSWVVPEKPACRWSSSF